MEKEKTKTHLIPSRIIVALLLIIIISISLFFRIRGLFWGEYQYLHPDERFLVWVTSNLQSVDKISDYFNTHSSSLNPHNRGHGFFVYGDFPIILTRYIAELFFKFIGWMEITQIGRILSALFDLGSVVLIFFVGKKIFGKWVGLLASAFAGMAVLQIQQSHFYTVDTFATFFTTLAVLIALNISTYRFKGKETIISGLEEDERVNPGKITIRVPNYQTIIHSILFGVIVGLAAASKINTASISLLLPIAFFTLWESYPTNDPIQKSELILRDLFLGGVFAILSFRIFQPYAFEGPGFSGIQFNPQWINNIRDLSVQSGGNVDFPPALQWARRNFFFSAKNLSLWGLGLPFSITAWLGIITMGWQILRGEWKKYLLIWVWTVGYFLWQSSLGNSVMRYQMPVYPMFALMAAWFIHFLFTYKPAHNYWRKPLKGLGAVVSIIALGGTIIWALMFSSIYERPITRIEASRWIYENVPGPINLLISQNNTVHQEIISFPYNYFVTSDNPYFANFTVKNGGALREIRLGKIIQQDAFDAQKSKIQISIVDLMNPTIIMGYSMISIPQDFSNISDLSNLPIMFSPPINFEENHTYQIRIENNGSGVISLAGSATANESSWDDGLPIRVDGYDAYGGIYQKDLNFEMYWPDDANKLDRFITTLNQSDYIFISSNRQWGTTTRVPERYPLTTRYYQELLGCPNIEELYYCYSIAKPGTYRGNLGFELIKVFESYPRIGNFEINDQFADEAFTVYDHPKVLIFKKSNNYDPMKVSQIFEEVDLTKVQYFTPKEFPDYPANLMMSESQAEIQQSGGTWSELFNTSSFINQNQVVTVIVWYLAILGLGILFYPLVRLGFNGLIDKGYAFSKLFALLIISFFVWIGGSNGILVTRQFIWIVFGVIFCVSLVVGFFTRKEIISEIKQYRSLFLWIEIVSLVLFVCFLLIRLGNPDLWHPSKGGEKPMDFSYLNAVIKSSTFPPYDPWFEGGYINYYYYGFVIAGIFVKWIGIQPSIAYNLVLPSWFSFLGIGAFSLIWNLICKYQENQKDSISNKLTIKDIMQSTAGKAGIAGIFLTLILGNLGTIRMIWQGLQKIGSPTGNIEVANFFERWLWTFKGIAGFLTGHHFSFYPGDWYWVPSRVLPQEPITEFPFFTFIYADLHAHLIAMPITVMAIAWALSVLFSKWKFTPDIPGWLSKLFLLIIGAIIVGSLRPTNTWDFPTYLLFGVIVIIYTILRYGKGFKTAYHLNGFWARLLEAGVIVIIFIFGTVIFFRPFTQWYGQAYSQIELWKGSHSPFWSYFTHWGLFLIILFSWFITETIQWMAMTPLSSAKKLFKYHYLVWFVFLGILSLVLFLMFQGINISWIVVPMIFWAGLLLLRKDQSDAKRFVLFLTGTALVLTLMVELIVLKGDIGRMNTVFKFYLQAWILFAIASGAAIFWIIPEINLRWPNSLNYAWQSILIVIVACTAMYPLTAAIEKIDDRINKRTPFTLDGMKYMETSTYFDEGTNLDLKYDYDSIRWMQENIIGSPVIVEANTVEYHWGSRYSIYTGLPGVVGWNWHQRQQRAVVPSTWITDRVDDVNNFYLTVNLSSTEEFLNKYDVSYIVVGQLEYAKYPGSGIGKFAQLDGKLWNEVYSNGKTSIYQVFH